VREQKVKENIVRLQRMRKNQKRAASNKATNVIEGMKEHQVRKQQ
jgi:hypothetical protein